MERDRVSLERISCSPLTCCRILEAIDKGSAEGGADGRFWTIVSTGLALKTELNTCRIQ
jgi:hypothetical protein